MKRLDVAVLGATGRVGQGICDRLRDHPWFEITSLTGKSSAGKLYGEAVNWLLSTERARHVPGMSLTVGRVRVGVDPKSLHFDALGRKVIRGAAGAVVLLAELLADRGWIVGD